MYSFTLMRNLDVGQSPGTIWIRVRLSVLRLGSLLVVIWLPVAAMATLD